MHVGGLSDEELVQLARDGHESAFDAIVHRYRAPLVSYCRRWLDPHRAEEVVQHTLMKAYLCVRDDVRPLAVRPWLYRVAHNAALNAVEKKGSDWEELDENYDGVPQPPQVAEQRARFLQIVDEIEALPVRQREALVLNEFEGRCYADIAAQLGTSESGVRGLLRRARRQLRETAAAVFLPFPVLREFVRSDGGRGRAGELIGTAGAAGGVGAAGGFAKVAAGVLAAGTIAGGGTAIQQSDEPLEAPDAKAADVASMSRAEQGLGHAPSCPATADEVGVAPSTVIRVDGGGARLGALRRDPSPTGFDGWVGGDQTDSGKTAQPVEEGEEESCCRVDETRRRSTGDERGAAERGDAGGEGPRRRGPGPRRPSSRTPRSSPAPRSSRARTSTRRSPSPSSVTAGTALASRSPQLQPRPARGGSSTSSGDALSGEPESNGGSGSYSISSWIVFAKSSPAIFARSVSPMSIPDETPAAVMTLPCSTTRRSVGDAPYSASASSSSQCEVASSPRGRRRRRAAASRCRPTSSTAIARARA